MDTNTNTDRETARRIFCLIQDCERSFEAIGFNCPLVGAV